MTDSASTTAASTGEDRWMTEATRDMAAAIASLRDADEAVRFMRDLCTVNELRSMNVRPHVAQNRSGRRSAIDGRTTRHAGYGMSQRIRKRIEEGFGWMKTIAGLKKTKFAGSKGSDGPLPWQPLPTISSGYPSSGVRHDPEFPVQQPRPQQTAAPRCTPV